MKNGFSCCYLKKIYRYVNIYIYIYTLTLGLKKQIKISKTLNYMFIISTFRNLKKY
jgi:hypothetical protein